MAMAALRSRRALPSLGLLLLVSASLLSAALCQENVLTLDTSSFDAALEKHNFIVVEFYAPWCGHCKQLAPEYEKAATILKEKNPEIVLAKVDADNAQNKALAAKFKVEGFPSLKIIRNVTNVQEYDGPREAEGIVDYLLRQVGPSSTHLATKEQADEFFGSNPVSVVAVVEGESSPELATFLKVTEVMRGEYSFAHTSDPSFLPEVAEPVKAPVVRVYKDFDDKFNDFKIFEEKDLLEFIQDKTLPVLVEMGQDPSLRPLLMKVFNLPVGKALLFYDYSKTDAEKVKESYHEAAKTYGPGLKFIFGNVDGNEQALEFFGVQPDETPAVMVHLPDNTKYLMKNVDSDGVVKFLKDFKAGDLVPFTKSEPIPEKNDGDVIVIVGKTFNDIVYKSGKNVLIEFYAPWCGHCKSLTPIYEKVGAAFRDDSTVTIAKMDATANDIPGTDFNVGGFPTIYLRTASGENILFEGKRTKEGIISFVKDNMTDVEPEVLEAKLEKEEAAHSQGAEKEQKDEL